MDYNTVAAEANGFLFDVGSLYAHLATVEDQRGAKGKRYSLALILLLMIFAKLCGEDTPTGMADWAQHRCQELVSWLQLKRATMPCHNTFRRVAQSAVSVAHLQAASRAFLTARQNHLQSVLLVIDGKTLRGTIPAGESQGVHLLAAYLPKEGIVLMQLEVAGKENEITVAPRLLAALDLGGQVVRADAMLTQRELSIQIMDGGGDYLWVVKENQATLRADIEEVFHPAPTASGWGQAPRDLRAAQTISSGHGRLEKRTLTATCFLNGYSDWPGLAQVFQLQRQVIQLRTGQTRHETIYGITSLTPQQACPRCLLQMMRDYWAIENGLHYRRDKTLREDATRMSHARQAQVLAILNNLVIAIVKRQGYKNLAAARRYYNAVPQQALRLLLNAPA
jgi:predicted transposase YbfD/YdcC